MPARPKLAVILGAGASHDVCPDSTTIKEGAWSPPIVATMFKSRALDEVLDRHPQAQALMASIRTEVRQGQKGFEESLGYWMQNTSEGIERQLLQVPIALHDYFSQVSENYTKDATNYSHLINCTVPQGIHTAFITFNYDTLLEKSLSNITGNVFGTERAYRSSSDWVLVKLHGSVGWGYPWVGKEEFEEFLQGIGAGHFAAAYERIRRVDSTLKPFDEIPAGQMPMDGRVLSVFWDKPTIGNDSIHVGISRTLMLGGILHYPALALPVPDKYQFVCPPAHVEALRTFLEDCENYLFIGFSARDRPFLDFFRQTAKRVKRLGVVTGQGELQDTVARLDRGTLVTAGVTSRDKYASDSGFTWFMENQIQSFIASIKA